MRILFYYISSGKMNPNIQLLVQTLLRTFPQDEYVVACARASGCGDWAKSENLRVITIENGMSTELTRLKTSWFGIRRIVKEVGPDLIWSHNLGPYRRVGVPQVLSMYNAYQVYPREVARYHPGNGLRVAMLRYFFRKSLRLSDGAIVQTPLMAQYVGKVRGAPDRIAAIPKAVETSQEVQPEGLPKATADQLDGGLGREAFTFLYVADGLGHKNHVTLIRAIQRLREQGVATRLVLTASREQLEGQAGDIVGSLTQSGHLVLVGWVQKQHLRALYENCDACAMPSVLESLSSAHLEAMQWERPQVSADAPYAVDLCGPGALYAKAQDPADWAEKMTMLMHDASLRARLVDEGAARMRQFPQSWREVAQKYRDFFAEVCAAGGKREQGQV